MKATSDTLCSSTDNYCLQCNCGRVDFRIFIGETAPHTITTIECGCGNWSAPVGDVLKACEAGKQDE